MNHSDKAIKTIELMNTSPEDWGLTPIKWVWERVLMPVQEICPTCYGHGHAYIYSGDGALFDQKTDKKFLKKFKGVEYPGHYAVEEFKQKNGIKYGRCPTCPQAYYNRGGQRHPCDKGTGKIIVKKKIKVLVGYTQWAKNTQFDSRFHDRLYNKGTSSQKSVKYVCELCSKSITGRWSHIVPVNGKGKDNVIHGMWIGEDCAKKFFGVEIVFDKKQMEGVKKSEIKRNYIIKMT